MHNFTSIKNDDDDFQFFEPLFANLDTDKDSWSQVFSNLSMADFGIDQSQIAIDSSIDTNKTETIVISSTMVMSTEITTTQEPDEDELMWKIISAVFVTLTVVLLIVSICLWSSLPSHSSTRCSQEITGFSLHSTSRA